MRKINLYGKSFKNENKVLYLAKKSISKIDPYFIGDANIVTPEESIFEKTDLKEYDDLDFIVTNSIESELTEYKEILELYSKNRLKNTKSVLAFKDIEDIHNTIGIL